MFLGAQVNSVVGVPPKYAQRSSVPDTPQPYFTLDVHAIEIIDVILLNFRESPLSIRANIINGHTMRASLTFNLTPRHTFPIFKSGKQLGN